MKPGTPPPVPPLGEAAIARLERGLFAALDARPLEPAPPRSARRRGLALALAGLAAAVTIFTVREGRRGERLAARAAQISTQISTTTSGSRIAIAGATLEVAPQSAVSFGGGQNGAVVVLLDRGTVTCEVAPRSKRAPFIVEAGATRVTVIGTRFSVHRVGEHATVSVDHGLVEVADTNMTELVHAGERYRPGEPITREPLTSEAAATAPVAAAPGPGAAAPVAAAPGPETKPPASASQIASVVASVVATRPSGPESARPLHVRRLARAEVAAPAPVNDAAAPSEAPARAEAPKPSAPSADPAPARAAAGAPGRSVQVLFELAAQLEVRDPEAALRIYGELAADEDGWAASALFGAARLEAERGQTEHARALGEAYLQRFPRGPNADDARALLAPAR